MNIFNHFSNINVLVVIGYTYFGCIGNFIFLELLVKEDPGIGILITFSQFLIISLHGFIFTAKCGKKKPRISVKGCFMLGAMFYITNVFNNFVFDLNIAVPLYMIFRAGTLIANLILGVIVLKKKYLIGKYISAGMITAGISLCIIISSQDEEKFFMRGAMQNTSELEDFFWKGLGIAYLIVILFISASMGILQETLYKKHGKHPQEALFYSHLIQIPLFLFLYSDLKEHILMAFESEPLPYLQFDIPRTIAYLIGIIIIQYVTICSVYFLTAECSSLTVTLVITLGEFSSLYLSNPFTVYHWIGTILVFISTVIFSKIPQKVQQMKPRKKTKTN